MLIRPIMPDDRVAAIALIETILRDEFEFPIEADEFVDIENAGSYYKGPADGFWIVGDVQGTIALKTFSSCQAALKRMFVAPGYRGREFGIGQALINHLIHHARTSGVTEIYLGTAVQFSVAHRFYKRNGFVEILPDDLPIGFSVMKGDDTFFCLRLERAA